MFLSTAFVGLASVKYNSKALSVLSLILASIAPLLTNASDTDHIGSFCLFVNSCIRSYLDYCPNRSNRA